MKEGYALMAQKAIILKAESRAPGTDFLNENTNPPAMLGRIE